MKTLTVLTATTFFLSSVFCANSHADELRIELHTATAQHLAGLQPLMQQQAHQAMLQTIIDIQAHQYAKQDAAELLALQVTATAQAE